MNSAVAPFSNPWVNDQRKKSLWCEHVKRSTSPQMNLMAANEEVLGSG
jgi:hypothetical protein